MRPPHLCRLVVQGAPDLAALAGRARAAVAGHLSVSVLLDVTAASGAPPPVSVAALPPGTVARVAVVGSGPWAVWAEYVAGALTGRPALVVRPDVPDRALAYLATGAPA